MAKDTFGERLKRQFKILVDADNQWLEETPKSDFEQVLDVMLGIHRKKSADYAQPENVYSNFEFAAEVAKNFADPVDRVFATMIGIKLARLQEVTQPGRQVNNESVEDTFIDLANYAAIWAGYRRSRNAAKEGN